jgi:PAS domain S-box-containing protein
MEKNKALIPDNIFILNSENLYETEIIQRCFNIVGVLVVATDLTGKIILINKKGCEILEFEENEVIGKDWINFFVDDETKDESHFHFEQLLNEEAEVGSMFPYVVRSKTGKKKVIETRTVILRNENNEIKGLLISGEDVTNFHTIQKELQNLIYQYRTLAGNMPDTAMYLFDMDLRFIIAEGSEMKRFNLSNNDFEGKTVYEVLDSETRKLLIPLYESAISGKEISTEYNYRGYDYIIWLLPLRNNDGEIYAGMAITQNITKEKQVSLNLRKAKELAEESNKAKSSFLASVSHEIRTPLNAIIGFAEQLSKTKLTKQQKNFIDIIDQSSEHLLALVNEILVLSKIDAGEVYFSKNPFKPSQIINEVYNTLRIKAQEKSINFKFSIDKNADFIVLGDAMRLKQILVNLVNNAIKFTESGFVELNCRAEEDHADKVKIRFDVTDTGIGIPEKKFEEIFEQFKQADSSIAKKYGGTGLGLTICKHLVELQNGKISVQSETGVGSQFTIIIPYKKTTDNHFELQEVDKIDTTILTNLKVLLVDDDGVNRLLGKTILENFKCNVDMAQNGKEAIDKITVRKYDVILLDIHMPEISGIDVANYIRLDMNDKDTIIIAVTAAVMKNDILQYFGAGINDYLIKPFKELNLFNKINKALGSGIRMISLENIENDREFSKKEVPLYDLSELERIAKNNPEFIRKMLNTFIQNSKTALKEMHRHLKDENWEMIGEHAHKILPSFRHLQVKSVVSDLVEIKTKTILKPGFDDVPDLVKKVTREIHAVNLKLRKEIRQIRKNS